MRTQALLACLLLWGCGPIQASNAIGMSKANIQEAADSGAEKYARYEYFKALAFLAQARLKNGYGEYQIARNYALRASDLAKEARATASRRRDLELRRIRGKQKLRPRVRPPKRPRTPGARPAPKARPTTPTTPVKRRQILPPGLQKKKPSGGDQ